MAKHAAYRDAVRVRTATVLALVTGSPFLPAGAAVAQRDFDDSRPKCYGKVATIVGTERDDDIVGTAKADVIVGRGGRDIINGGRGNDVLTGGDGNDTFVFSARSDMDTIVDFTHGEDMIDLSGWSKVDSFADFLKRAEDHGDDLWIIAGKDMLVIKDQHKADMHADDFTF